jgi:hypothetical protein
MKFQAAAMSRSNIPEDQRVDFSLYVDEFQNFSTDSFATIMSEARKYHLNLIVANQFTTQLTEEIRDAVFGNMGTIIAFRVGQNDVEALTRYFQPIFDQDDLLRVPNYNTIVRTLIGGVPTQPFSMATLPPLGSPNPRLADALKQLSAAKHGKPRPAVEQEISKRLATRAPAARTGAASGFGGSPYARPGGGAMGGGSIPSQASPQPTGAAPAAATGGGSFLDNWLAKRRSHHGGAAPSANPVVPAAPQTPPATSSPAPVSSAPPNTPPATTSKPSAQTPAATKPKNISSDELSRDEVDKIAAELKQELDQSKSTPKQPAPKKTEHVAELKPGKDDTIFIGRDGSFNQTKTDI